MNVHIFVSNLSCVHLSKIIFHILDWIWSINSVGVLFSQVFENNFILHIFTCKAKLFNIKGWWLEFSRYILVLSVNSEWICFGKLMCHCSVPIDHHSHSELFSNFRQTDLKLNLLPLLWRRNEGCLRILALLKQLKVSAERGRNRLFIFEPLLIHGFNIRYICCR